MRETYYLRVRGKTSGPSDFEGLKSLVAEGKLSRAHEISTDGKNWVQASSIPELFDRPKTVRPVKEIKSSEPETLVESGSPTVPPGGLTPAVSSTPPTLIKEWHYSANGVSLGPISTEELGKLIQVGSLNKDSQVWKQGMPQWVPVGYLPEFASVLSNPVSTSHLLGQRHDHESQSKSFKPKSKATAVLLALLLGGLGIHHFYLGNYTRGIVTLVLTILVCGLGAIVALVEAILIAASSEENFKNKWCNLG